jgi:hypothetical protein
MISREIVVFNILSLVITLGLSALLFSYTAVSHEKRLAAKQPLPMEAFADVDLGPDYGEVSVSELMGYYLENPPVQESGTVAKQQHFGGC